MSGNKRRQWMVVVVLMACSATALSQARPALKTLIDSLTATQTYYEVAISPDGNLVAWSQWVRDASGASTWNTAIYVEDLTGPHVRTRVTAGDGQEDLAERDLAWSPDSRQLAFLSNASGQTELYVAGVLNCGSCPLNVKPASRKLTNVSSYVVTPRWSPNGKAIAFLFTENAPRAAGPLMPMTPETGVIDSKIYEQRLTTVDVESGQIRQLSPADMYVYEYDWAPDSNGFAVTAASGAGDDNWYIARLYTLGLDGHMHEVYRPAEQMAEPHFSPDGKSIAFIAGIMSDEGATGGDIYVAPAGGGAARDLTPGIKASPNWLVWSSPRQILFSENLDGSVAMATLDVASGKVQTLWSGAESVGADGRGNLSLSLAKDGNHSAVIRQSFTQPPEVWAGAVGGWKQITHANQNLRPTWGRVGSIHWTNGGMRVQGWLISRELRPRPPLSPGGGCTRWSGMGAPLALAGKLFQHLRTIQHGVLCALSQPARQLWAGRSVRPGECEGFRLRRLS